MTRRPNTEARPRILKAALELFATEGYEGASMDRVAEAVGMKKANLFHYYPSKEALGAAVIAEAARHHAEVMRGLFASGDEDPATTVKMMFERGVSTSGRDCSRGCFIGKMGQEIDVRNALMRVELKDCMRQWRAEVTEYFDGWRRKGYFRNGFRAIEAADMVIALYEGSILVAKVLEDEAPVEHARRTAVAVVVSWRA